VDQGRPLTEELLLVLRGQVVRTLTMHLLVGDAFERGIEGADTLRICGAQISGRVRKPEPSLAAPGRQSLRGRQPGIIHDVDQCGDRYWLILEVPGTIAAARTVQAGAALVLEIIFVTSAQAGQNEPQVTMTVGGLP